MTSSKTLQWIDTISSSIIKCNSLCTFVKSLNIITLPWEKAITSLFSSLQIKCWRLEYLQYVINQNLEYFVLIFFAQTSCFLINPINNRQFPPKNYSMLLSTYVTSFKQSVVICFYLYKSIPFYSVNSIVYNVKDNDIPWKWQSEKLNIVDWYILLMYSQM